MSPKYAFLSVALALCLLLLLFAFLQPAVSQLQPASPLKPDSPETASAIISWQNDQINPAIAYGASLNKYLVVWEDHHWGFGEDWDIYARFVDSDGDPSGSSFPVSWEFTNTRSSPQVAFNTGDGEFLVVWEYGYSTSDHDIYARRVYSDGSLGASEIPIATSSNNQSYPSVAYDASNNRYLVVWQEYNGADYDILGRVINAQGTPLSGDISLAIGVDTQKAPAVTYNPISQEYLVVWQYRPYATENTDIHGRRVDYNGELLGSEITVSSANYDQIKPRLAASQHSGQYLVVWEDLRDSQGASRDVYAQFIQQNGALNGSNFLVSPDVVNHQGNPDVAFDAFSGEFLVVWEYEYIDTDHDIYCRRVGGDGSLPENARVVSNLGSQEANPAVAADTDLGYYLVWEDSRNAATMAVDIYGDTQTLDMLSGRVYAGDVGDESSPLEGVGVTLFASNNLGELGVPIGSMPTTIEGWYGLIAPPSYDYYNLVPGIPPGYTSVGATSVSGTVVTTDHIRYVAPLADKVHTGNKFWAKLSDLTLIELGADVGIATPDQEVTLAAVVYNAGPGAFTNVPVRFYANEMPFSTEEIGELGPGITVTVTTRHVFGSSGTFTVTATVNPEASLPEESLDNNSASMHLNVVFEAAPGWYRPDLVLSDLLITPHRPNPADPLTISASLSNEGRADVPTSTVNLLVDGAYFTQTLVEDITSGSSTRITITMESLAPGRHAVSLVVDPDQRYTEKSEANNMQDGFIRVSGEAVPLPDLEALQPVFADLQLNMGDSTIFTSTVCNQGYQAAYNLPVAILIDGREVTRQQISELPPDQCASIPAEWLDIGEGEHTITTVADPDDILPDDSIFAKVSTEVIIPGFQYNIPPAITPLQWEAIGPDTIDSDAYVGRIDSIAISAQDSNRILVGAPAGGVWLSDSGGNDWQVVADRLKTPGFSVVAFDPTNDDILYVASGSPLWGSGSGLYKSVDGGAHWTLFADTGIGSGYGGLILRYDNPPNVTILAGTDTGVWTWQGSKTVTKTQTAQWQHVWTNPTPNKTSKVMDMLVTAESTPHLYIAVYKDTVYRVNANSPAGAWTRLNEGWPSDAVSIQLGNSPASSDLIYASVEPPGKCDPNDDRSALLDIYTRRTSESTWTKVSRPTDESHICGLTFNAFIRVDPDNADIVYIAGVRGWRSTDGGETFPTTIPTVHDDYKEMAFDPADASIGWFVTDGGVYRCTNMDSTMSCSGRNHDLAVTMFYDFALTNGNADRILGGTQDNGNIFTNGSLSWNKLSYGGDGKYCAIDPNNANTMVAQYQYADSTARSTNGGTKFDVIKTGLPSAKQYSGDPFLVMHPGNSNVMLLTAETVYRTTDAGGQWNDIGPNNLNNNEQVSRLAIDSVNNRYYAGTTDGRIFATSGSSISWTNIYTQGYGAEVSNILVDSSNPNIVYLSLSGWTNRRVIKLTHSGGWPGTWTEDNRTGNFPNNISLSGGMSSAIRGLFKDPTADILYVGTNAGVYQGQKLDNTWQWLPDTCGLPLTYISDLEYADGVLRAASFGRSAFKRTLSNPTPDPFDTPDRNDTLATRTQLPTMVRPASFFQPSMYVENLNFDRMNDVDYFTTNLPPAQTNDCLPPGDPLLSNPKCQQCAFSVAVQAPDNPQPLELRMYNANGSQFNNFTSSSFLDVYLERPRDFFPTGHITVSVRSPNSCRSSYSLMFNFMPWQCEYDAPNLLTDPPMFKRIIPELDDFSWRFPMDLSMVNQGFTGQMPDEIPAERLIFNWEQPGDFQSTFNIHGFGNLNATLYNSDGNPVASAAPLAPGLAPASGSSQKQISVDDLPAGWYALDFNQADFPTWFDVKFWLPRLYLPVIYR